MKNRIMKFKIILATILTCLSVQAFAVSPGLSESYKKLQTYYLKPQPEIILPTMAGMYSEDILNNSNVVAVATLFGRLIQKENISADEIMKQIRVDQLNDIEKLNLALIFKYAGQNYKSPSEQVAAQFNPQNLDNMKAVMNDFPPIDAVFEKLENKLWKLPVTNPFTWSTAADCMWSSFFATGDTKYVNGVVLLLDKLNNNATGNKDFIEANKKTMIWSLTANAITHEKVLKYLSERSEISNKDISDETRVMMALAIVTANNKRK